MEGKDRHYYPSGPYHIPAPTPLYSTSCFITPHHPKRRYENRWAIPPAFTDDDGYQVFHTIITRILDQHQTMPLRKKTYRSLMPLLITMTLSRTSPPEPLILVPSSSPSTSKASGITAFEKPEPRILSMTSSARTPTIPVRF